MLRIKKRLALTPLLLLTKQQPSQSLHASSTTSAFRCEGCRFVLERLLSVIRRAAFLLSGKRTPDPHVIPRRFRSQGGSRWGYCPPRGTRRSPARPGFESPLTSPRRRGLRIVRGDFFALHPKAPLTRSVAPPSKTQPSARQLWLVHGNFKQKISRFWARSSRCVPISRLLKYVGILRK